MISSTFTSWWFPLIRKICSLVDHFPRVRDENKKKIETTTHFQHKVLFWLPPLGSLIGFARASVHLQRVHPVARQLHHLPFSHTPHRGSLGPTRTIHRKYEYDLWTYWHWKYIPSGTCQGLGQLHSRPQNPGLKSNPSNGWRKCWAIISDLPFTFHQSMKIKQGSRMGV